jgi:glutathione synthase/RimK-type ligase-like ATP-grasp enzyme
LRPIVKKLNARSRIALATSASARHLDEDLPPLLAVLSADVVVWDDPAIDWAAYELVVVRSTWDYVPRRDEFLAWAERVPRLANPARILRWNTDKHYLRELGPNVVPTTFIEPGDPVSLPEGELVVKPAISAGSIDTARHASRDAAAAHVRRLQAQGRSVMVQPYVRDIDRHGETALVYFNGEFSHAIRKGSILGTPMELVEGLYAKEDIRPREPSAEERRVADDIIRRAPGPLLYARVDLVPGPLLLEFEATEPSLFFNYAPGSVEKFVNQIRQTDLVL